MSGVRIKSVLVGFAALLGAGASLPVVAQSSPSDFTNATRYDADGRVVGTIEPDPDGTGGLHYAAVRNTYDAAGRVIRVENGEIAAWQSESIAPSAWTGFTVFKQVDTTYDAMSHKVKDVLSVKDPVTLVVTIYGVTQYSYDPLGRLDCTAVRMNPALFASPPSTACSPGTEGSQGPDRITKSIYDAAGQVLKVQKGYGTTLQQDYATYSYNLNGKQTSVIDANGSKAAYSYDGQDRQIGWYFPSTTTSGAASATDYEAYGYDPNGNRTSLRKRDGRTITYSYDALNRMTVKDITGACVSGYACTPPPSWAVRDVYYGYDLRGLQVSARYDSATGADGILNAFGGFGQLSSSTTAMGGISRTLSYLYNADMKRVRVTHPDGVYFTYDYDGLDRAIAVKENGTTQVASFSYDAQGHRAAGARGGRAHQLWL